MIKGRERKRERLIKMRKAGVKMNKRRKCKRMMIKKRMKGNMKVNKTRRRTRTRMGAGRRDVIKRKK